MTNPKVTVITVSYNSVKTMEQTIISVIEQTYDNIEYIVIDGGSTDGTIDIIKKYTDRVAYWISEPDDGIYHAINKGLMISSGDIIGIINSDDWYDKDAIMNVVDHFNQVNCDIVHGDLVLVNQMGEFISKRKPDIESKNTGKRMVYNHPTCFIKKNFYQKYGLFNTDYRIAADYDLLLRFYGNGVVFSYLPENVAYFRVGGISTTKVKEMLQESRVISIKYGCNKVYANILYLLRYARFCLKCKPVNKTLNILVCLYKKYFNPI